VVIARAPESLSVPVHTGRLRSDGRLQPMAVAVAMAASVDRSGRRTADGPARRHRRCRSGGRSLLLGSGRRLPHDPRPSVAVYPVRVGRCSLPPRCGMLGRRRGKLRGRSGLAGRLRSALVDGSREIRNHPPGNSADHSRQRRRLALDPGAREHEHRQRDPHRRNENCGHGRRQMSEGLHSRVFAVAAVRSGRTLLRKPYRGTRRFSTIPVEFSTRPSSPRGGADTELSSWTSARAASHAE
jgi:hypothetical protein